MKTLPLKCAASGLGLLLCGVSMARAQEQIHITPPSVGRVEQISPAKSASEGTVTLDAKPNSVATAVLAKLRAHEMTPREAWQSGALTVDDLIYLLENKVDEWGGFYWEKDVELRRALESLLAQNGGEKIKDNEKLSPKVRVWLADYYGSVKDERAVPVAESVLSEFKDKEIAPAGNTLAFLALERLAWYYRDIGQPEKAAQEILRTKNYQPADDWRVADAMIVAARMYARAGKRDEANALYQQVKAHPDKYFSSLGIFDPARNLVESGQQKAAQQMLKAALPTFENNKEQIKLLSLLSRSFYLDGDFDSALLYGERAIAQAKDVNWDTNRAEEAPLNMARDVVRDVKSWQKSPIRVEPNALQVQLPAGRTTQIIKRLRVKTRRDVPLQVTSSSPDVQARIIEETLTGADGREADREVVVQIMPNAAAKDVTLTFSSAQMAGNEAKVSVQLSAGN